MNILARYMSRRKSSKLRLQFPKRDVVVTINDRTGWKVTTTKNNPVGIAERIEGNVA